MLRHSSLSMMYFAYRDYLDYFYSIWYSSISRSEDLASFLIEMKEEICRLYVYRYYPVQEA